MCAAALVVSATHDQRVGVARNHVRLGKASDRDRHDLHVPVGPDTPGSIVAFRADHTRHLRAVASAICNVIAPSRIPSAVVVHIAVAIVVDAVAGDLGVVEPAVTDQIRMEQIGSFHHAHHDGITRCGQSARGDVPGLRGLDLRVVPLLGHTWIIRKCPIGHRHIVLRHHHLRVPLDGFEHPFLANCPRRELQQPDAHGCADLLGHVHACGDTIHLLQVARHVLRTGTRG